MIYEPCIILKDEMVHIDDTARVDSFCKIEGGLGVHIGKGVHISSFAHLNIGGGRLHVGDYVALTSGVRVLTGSNTPSGQSMSSAAPIEMQVVERGEVVIGDYAFVGAGATILQGVKVGEYAIVGAGAVVTRDVPAHAVVMGMPARVVGHRANGAIVYHPKLRDLAAHRDVAIVQQHYREVHGDELPESVAADLVETINAMSAEMTA